MLIIAHKNDKNDINIDLNRKHIKITVYTYSILAHKTVINLSTINIL